MKYNFNILFAITGYAPYLLLQADTERNEKHSRIDRVYVGTAGYIHGQSKSRVFFGNTRVFLQKTRDNRRSLESFGHNPESFGQSLESFGQSLESFVQRHETFVQRHETRITDTGLLKTDTCLLKKDTCFFIKDTCDSGQINLTVNYNKNNKYVKNTTC
jgi:hypothetical protein